MFDSKYSDRLKKDIQYTEELLKRYLPEINGYQSIIFDAMQYSCMAGGKRIRPVLILETFKALNGEDSAICEPFMAAMEMIHTYSLVHDDLPCMDNDEFRRGKKTTWSRFGENFGVLCGDALLNQAFEVSVAAINEDNCHLTARAARILSSKAGSYGMLGGQVVDVLLTDKPIDSDRLDFIYRLKTGALIEASMMIGAVLAGADETMLNTVEEIASRVGMAFQIRDDILDVTSTTEILGKPVLSDEKNNKTTYVSIYGLDNAQKKVEELMDCAQALLQKLPGDTGMIKYIFDLLVNREK